MPSSNKHARKRNENGWYVQRTALWQSLQGPSLSLRAALGEGDDWSLSAPSQTLALIGHGADLGEMLWECPGTESLPLSWGQMCAVGKGLQQECTCDKNLFPTRQKWQKWSEPLRTLVFSRRQQARPRQAQRSSQRSPRKLVGGQSGLRLPSPVPRDADLSSKACRHKGRPGTPSQRHPVPSRPLIPSSSLSTKGWCSQPAPCTLQSWAVWAPVSFTGHSLQSCPPGTRNAGGWKTKSSTKGRILFRHQPFAPAKPEETSSRALTPSALHVGSRNGSPAPCTEQGGQSFLRRGGWWESSAPAFQGCSRPEDRNYGD